MRLSVVVPAMNEAQGIERTLQRAKNELKDGDELIIVDGGSKDATVTISARLGKVLVTEPGRGVQMHRGAMAAQGDVLLFLHADTLLPEGWRTVLAEAWDSSPRPALTAFGLRFDARGAYFRLMETLALWRMRLTEVPHGDQAIAVDAAAYHESGGFPPVPLMEEYELRKRLRGGLRLLPSPVTTSARRYEKNGPFFNNMRNLLILFLYHVGVSPEQLARLYR